MNACLMTTQRILICLLLFVLLFAIFPNTASLQTAEQSSWPVEQNCLGAITPPSNWTFEGRIFLKGNSGVHEYQADWDTPRVAVFLHKDKAMRGGALSPDGNWYAYPWGEFVVTESYNAITSVEELRVHSTLDEHEYSVPVFEEDYHGRFSQAFWINNEQILFYNWREPYTGIVVINPFSGEMEKWEPFVNAVEFLILQYVYPSSDWATVVAPYLPTSASSQTWEWGLFSNDGTQFKRIIELPLGDPYDTDAVMAWSPDSSEFAAYSENAISLFNTQGEVTDTILSLVSSDYPYVALDSIHWSPDGNYITFVLSQDENWTPSNLVWPNYADVDYGRSRLFIADMQNRTVMDTCLEVG